MKHDGHPCALVIDLDLIRSRVLIFQLGSHSSRPLERGVAHHVELTYELEHLEKELGDLSNEHDHLQHQ